MTTEIQQVGAHTPGPWEIAINGPCLVIRKQFRADHHMDICGPVHGYMYAKDEKGNQAANARLIAAAPDLLAALNGLIAVINDAIGDPEDIDLYQRALAVVAKATGAAA